MQHVSTQRVVDAQRASRSAMNQYRQLAPLRRRVDVMEKAPGGHVAHIGDLTCGPTHPLLLIAGPCVLQDESTVFSIAEAIMHAVEGRDIGLVFKASFDKANRTSGDAARGPGIDNGLRLLQKVRDEFAVAVTTDVHLPEQAEPAAEVCDLLQIPAFLSRQTDLVHACAATSKAVNIKKGQFMSPDEMEHVVKKARATGNSDVLVCERGTFFGYGRLVNDMTALDVLRQWAPVIFDATHSVQQPGALGGASGGNSKYAPGLARAATAFGIDGLFLETHTDPLTSPSDGPNMIPTADLPRLLDDILAIRAACSPRES